MSSIKNYMYDKSIELANELGDPLLADDIYDMVTTYMVDKGMTLACALDQIKIRYQVSDSIGREIAHNLHLA